MKPYIDLNDFYEHGFAITKLQLPLFRAIQPLVQATRWLPDTGGVYNRLPDFSLSHDMDQITHDDKLVMAAGAREQSIAQFPSEYVDFLKQLLLDPNLTGEWQGLYDFKVEFMDLWDGAEDTSWHFDGTDNADLIILLYLTDEPRWDPAWGGQLETGKRHLTRYGLLEDFDSVEHTGTVWPANRNLVFVNNRNPRLVHRPRPLLEDRQRITFHAGIQFVVKDSMSRPAVVSTLLDDT